MGMLWGWTDIDESEPWAYAFRMYRNYDGQESLFGEMSLTARSADEASVSIYASRRNGDGALTIMLINKLFAEQAIDLDLNGLGGSVSAEVYRYSDADLNQIETLERLTLNNGSGSSILPAQSITLLVLPVNQLTYVPTATPLPTLTPTPSAGESDLFEPTPTPFLTFMPAQFMDYNDLSGR